MVTLGYIVGKIKIEGSVFRGCEPDNIEPEQLFAWGRNARARRPCKYFVPGTLDSIYGGNPTSFMRVKIH